MQILHDRLDARLNGRAYPQRADGLFSTRFQDLADLCAEHAGLSHSFIHTDKQTSTATYTVQATWDICYNSQQANKYHTTATTNGSDALLAALSAHEQLRLHAFSAQFHAIAAPVYERMLSSPLARANRLFAFINLYAARQAQTYLQHQHKGVFGFGSLFEEEHPRFCDQRKKSNYPLSGNALLVNAPNTFCLNMQKMLLVLDILHDTPCDENAPFWIAIPKNYNYQERLSPLSVKVQANTEEDALFVFCLLNPLNKNVLDLYQKPYDPSIRKVLPPLQHRI